LQVPVEVLVTVDVAVVVGLVVAVDVAVVVGVVVAVLVTVDVAVLVVVFVVVFVAVLFEPPPQPAASARIPTAKKLPNVRMSSPS
jgi:hypothetical protein